MARREARDLLRKSYLLAANASSVQPPLTVQANTDCYGDGTHLRGDPGAGKLLYESACARCHGTDINPLKEGQLLASDQRFHRFVWQGTERNGVYMPRFTAERLSRRQVADIRAYLRSLPKPGSEPPTP
jgi:mono/diheme cytochrome c family protein